MILEILYVQVKTEVPVYLNKKQKELLEQFREIENERSNPSIKKFFQKAKDFGKIKKNLNKLILAFYILKVLIL